MNTDEIHKEVIQAVASAQGESVNSFISTAIDERIERLSGSQGGAPDEAEGAE